MLKFSGSSYLFEMDWSPPLGATIDMSSKVPFAIDITHVRL